MQITSITKCTMYSNIYDVCRLVSVTVKNHTRERSTALLSTIPLASDIICYFVYLFSLFGYTL